MSPQLRESPDTANFHADSSAVSAINGPRSRRSIFIYASIIAPSPPSGDNRNSCAFSTVTFATIGSQRGRRQLPIETHAHSLRLPSQLLEAGGDRAGAGGHQPDLLAARPVDLPLHHR